MKFQHIGWTIGLALLVVLAAACSPQTSAEQQDTDQIVKTAVAATLAVRTPTPTLAADAPTPTLAADAPTPTLAVDVPTPTLAADAPTPTLAADAPTPTLAPKLIVAESDVDGNAGDDFLRGSSDSNQGRVVLLPGLSQSAVTDPVVFGESIVFQIEVFDTRAGFSDGAGIESVSFQIVAGEGAGPVIHENELREPPYCAFGGTPECTIWSFVGHDKQWPNGEPVANDLYLVQIDIVATDGSSTQWFWRFAVDVPEQSDPTQPTYAARIEAIRVQEGRYVVDFATAGFDPTLPGQHLHFFFNTVPPQEAGLPGKGPWQLYPASPGESGSSPFTHYAVADRPDGATQLCVLVANPDHSVIVDSGNCLDLP
ncbi:MAG: hypothetical protein JXA89_05145 [Anaerolineae bacterium]|nr:hypothetical protein [Anaerolineae bacterium]